MNWSDWTISERTFIITGFWGWKKPSDQKSSSQNPAVNQDVGVPEVTAAFGTLGLTSSIPSGGGQYDPNPPASMPQAVGYGDENVGYPPGVNVAGPMGSYGAQQLAGYEQHNQGEGPILIPEEYSIQMWIAECY